MSAYTFFYLCDIINSLENVMKKNINKKTKLIVAIISTTVFAIICTAMIIGGLMIENDDCVVAGAMLLIIFIPMFLWWIFTLVKIKNTISSNHLATNPFKDKILEKFSFHEKARLKINFHKK